jgi:hypothetical protein
MLSLNRGCTCADSLVVVLTDFYPFSLCYPGIESGEDWAAKVTLDYERSPEYNPTTGPLFSLLNGGEQPKSLTFLKTGIFLWNFFPFFRGCISHSGASGLPTDSNWLNLGLLWLNEFLQCVRAHTVILACSRDAIPDLKGAKGNYEISLSNTSSLPWPWNIISQLPCKRLYRIYHPSSWNRVKKENDPRQSEICKEWIENWKRERTA